MLGGILKIWINKNLDSDFEDATQIDFIQKTAEINQTPVESFAGDYYIKKLSLVVKNKEDVLDFEQFVNCDLDVWVQSACTGQITKINNEIPCRLKKETTSGAKFSDRDEIRITVTCEVF